MKILIFGRMIKMNKRKLLILTVISIMLAVSCGSSGGSGSGATSDSTPTG